MRTVIVALVALAALEAVGTGAHAQEQGEVRAGETYARAVCQECHAVGRGEKESTYDNAPPFSTIMERPEMTGMAVAAWLQREHDNMPHIVPLPEEMNDLIAYMVSLKR